MARPKRTSTPTNARSSPRLSSASAKSTPTRAQTKEKGNTKASTPLKQSVTSTPTRGKWIEKSAKTSPYFPKANVKSNGRSATKASSSKPPGRGKAKAKSGSGSDQEDVDDNEDTAGDLTESENSSSSDDGGSEDDFDPSSEDEDEPIEDDEESLDSDHLDEDPGSRSGSNKRKSLSGGGRKDSAKKPKPGNRSAAKSREGKGNSVYVEGYEDEDEEDDDDVELEEGQEIAGRIYPAPKTGQVPPGRISQNTLNFLKNLQIPERNDREWFRSHEPAFRQAEKEWKAFVGIVQMKFHEADDEVPILPPKDIIHRIYRDVRFSSDKTPYKRGFSMSTSRGGRKGVWAAYHLSISPNGRSLIAAGVWQPGKNELATIRHHLLADPRRLRDVIEAKEFVELFGEAKEKKGKRQNVFGHEDALKVAPKGVEKDHKDIDLLKLRSVAVVHHLTDEQVVAEDFQDQLYDILTVMRPFVRTLNEFIALPPGTGDNDNDDNGNGDEGNE